MHVGLAMVLALGLAASEEDRSTLRKPAPWTVLIYAGVDSSAEDHIMPHLRSLALLSREGQNAEVLLLIDRSPGHSEDEEILAENFEDTRLFQLKHGKWNRVAGGSAFPEITLKSNFEANSGDAHTLRKFIDFGKQLAPAEKYALILFGHGDSRSVCPDVTSPSPDKGEFDDPLYVAEITDVLSDRQSVDLLWFDVCSFGGIENAYQFRPGRARFSARTMLASSPINTPAPMSDILRIAGILGVPSADKKLPNDSISFGSLAISVIQQHLQQLGPSAAKEAWGCYDLTVVDVVKHSVDRLAVALADSDNKETAERIRGVGRKPIAMNYMHRNKGFPRAWVASPHFDLYDMTRRFSENTQFTEAVHSAAKDVMVAVDKLVVASLGGKSYRGFEAGKNGIYIIFPNGDALWREKPQWNTFNWYHPDDRRGNRYEFGNYAWCADGAKRENGVVDNWYELLDSWFDTDDDEGGINRYKW